MSLQLMLQLDLLLRLRFVKENMERFFRLLLGVSARSSSAAGDAGVPPTGANWDM